VSNNVSKGKGTDQEVGGPHVRTQTTLSVHVRHRGKVGLLEGVGLGVTPTNENFLRGGPEPEMKGISRMRRG